MHDIDFSNWVHWSDRTSLNGIENPGIYLLARFRSAPNGKARPLSEKIIYIGETCRNSLKGRWYQFDRSAFHGKSGHSGGWTYRDLFGDRGKNLYVAAQPVVDLEEELCPLFIRYIERRLIWEFASKHGVPPKCNKK
jgi:hypothetical protein